MTTRGRPPLLADDIILDAALAAFASAGYDAMSVRALNADLGLSHETISKRFGPKIDLFRAAVAHGMETFATELEREIGDQDVDDLTRLRGMVRAFMVTAARHHALGQLLSHEGIGSEEREVLVDRSGLVDHLAEVVGLLDRLHREGIIVETRIRELWFLTQGAVAPLHLRAMSAMFDPYEGPVDADELIDRMTDAIMRSMGVSADPVS